MNLQQSFGVVRSLLCSKISTPLFIRQSTRTAAIFHQQHRSPLLIMIIMTVCQKGHRHRHYDYIESLMGLVVLTSTQCLKRPQQAASTVRHTMELGGMEVYQLLLLASSTICYYYTTTSVTISNRCAVLTSRQRARKLQLCLPVPFTAYIYCHIIIRATALLLVWLRR